ncbi:hypothetical protein I5U22_12730 [Serratia ureilytica]|uniref:Uncharacterized protein n=1 Tax=Serratia ureilytica TaxID=300181 RepID=A0ABU0VIN9_9GAMM|nr:MULTISPECIES: hypothetical protein [Serratia]MBH1902205.1 hypothetical protein [Serratia ureilytica]MCU7063743.1 hypothetical protein [Serratia ureilytica]MDQ1809810.1 hypothetical protein [Serratia ureilytica]MDQ1838954.1 hypothetical protein [Serratia ureilytica]MDQ1861306.1 hypothetical protein [Serratia ureilytica]
MKRIGLLIAALAAFHATASSPQAWAESERAMRAACLKASGLKNARVEGDIIHYGDDVGYSALFIGGRYPQPFMKNQPGRELCLYQRATQKVAVQAVAGE